MKTSKAPENTTVTPPQKKLKQARLPFKHLSDVSQKPVITPTRKRKLSVPDPEPVTKVGKISNENDLAEELVVISDDDKDEKKTEKEEKPVNPFVVLVDMAWKKKLHKKKLKKRGKNKPKKDSNGPVETQVSAQCVEDMETDDVDMVEVQIHVDDEDYKSDDKRDSPNDNLTEKQKDETNISEITPQTIKKCDVIKNASREDSDTSQYEDIASKKTSELIKKSIKTVCDILCIEDSNSCSEVTQTGAEVEKTIGSQSTENSSDTKNTELTDKNIKKPDSPKKIKSIDSPKTPKRSARNKAKAEEKADFNMSTASSQLDESVSSESTTPKHNTRSSSVTNSQGDESLNESSTVTVNLTPKQLKKKQEFAKRREEREKEKQEKEIKRQQEKEERAKQRQEKDDQRKKEREEKEEAKRKEREEKEEQKKKEREEKEKMKELEKKQKEMKEEQKRKEKEDKEEQRRKEKEAREEERRKKQEALDLEKQEQELKKKKAAEAFVNFFVPKQKLEKDQTVGPVSKSSVLSSFAIKVDMRLAPTIRVDLSDEKREVLDKGLEEQDISESELYLKSLKGGTAKSLSSGKTWPLSDKDDDDIMIVEDELPPIDSTGEIVTCESATREKLRPKLLSFHENRRPPYWGTWRKKSAVVKPRKPFGQDEKQLDYEVDSDDDWEEEQEGESLDGSACGSDDEPDARDDYEVDNEVFVPHGYLSDEEATMDEEDNDMLSLSPETQKARLKHLEDEFESEMKKPTEKLKPRLYGILWETKEGKPDNCVDALWNYFEKFAMVLNDPTALLQPSNEPEESEKKKVKKKKVLAEGEEPSPKPDKKKKAKSETKDGKKPKSEAKKTAPNQPGINSFLTKMKTT